MKFIRSVGVSLLALGTLGILGTSGCGGGGGLGGSPASNNIQHPLVRQFSPTMSPIDFNTGLANPTYTDGDLTVSTEPAYPGKICVFFQTGTQIDKNTVFLGGNPALGLDLSAFQVLRYIPGTGNVPLPYSQVDVLDDRIIFTPQTLPLPNGQYSIGVFANLKSTDGDPVQKAPVFHSFTVGVADTIAPVVVVTTPNNNSTGVGAGTPPPAPGSGAPASSIADVRTAIFGPTSPDIIVRFSESIASATVSPNNFAVVNASAFVGGGGAPPPIAPAPGYPKLRSQVDQSSLPSNGFEVVWKANPTLGGLPFGAQVQVTVVGSDNGANASPIADRSGNKLQASYVFQFQTVAPPKLPANPEPEWAIYYSTSDRIGVIDTVNQHEIASVFLGFLPAGTLVVPNVLVPESDKIATKATLGSKFDPNEISVDARTNAATGHSYAYIQSFQSGQIVIINTRTSLPVALINTPSPGGLSNQTGGGQAANVLLATNSSANTFTVFNIASLTTGQAFLNAPITISQVSPTGNTPKAITITSPSTGAYNRDFLTAGSGVPMIMYADFTDGVVNTANLGNTKPIKQFALGTGASPNDLSFTPCFGPPAIPPIMFAAISEGGAPGDGKVAYYIAGPGCTTGASNGIRPDSLVGDLSGFDAPAGLDCIFPVSAAPFFAMAESGSTANHVVTLGTQNGAGNLPKIVNTLDTGANPVAVAHPPSWFAPASGSFICAPPGAPGCPAGPPSFIYNGTYQSWWNPNTGQLQAQDGSGKPSLSLYVCVRGAGRIEVVDFNTGARPVTPDRSPAAPPADKIAIPGVRNVNSTCSQ